MQMRKGIPVLLSILIFGLSGCGPAVLAGEDSLNQDIKIEQETETASKEDQKGQEETTEATVAEITSEELLQELDSYFERINAKQLPEEKQWISAYAQQIQVLVEDCKAQCDEDVIDFADRFADYEFDMVYLDEDDIPELAAGPTGFYVSIYTYEPGNGEESMSGTLHTVMDQWRYGAFGNQGYEYLPEENMIRNYDADYAGSVQMTFYMNMNKEYELDGYMIKLAYLDEDGNVFTGETSEEHKPQEHYYYCCEDVEREISKEEFSSYQINGDYEQLIGTKSGLEIMEELYQYYLACCD